MSRPGSSTHSTCHVFSDFGGGISPYSGIAEAKSQPAFARTATISQERLLPTINDVVICHRSSLFGPVIPIYSSILVNHRDRSERAETSNERTRHV